MLAITPSRIDLWYELGAKAVQLGDWKNAEFAYRKYMAFGGDKTKALQNVVLLHFVSGDFLGAFVLFYYNELVL
jgi:Flp pilus assembly protein TadD